MADIVNNGSKPLSALFFEASILDTFWGPVCFHFHSILAPFGTLGLFKVRLFAFWGALERAFAHNARAGAIPVLGISVFCGFGGPGVRFGGFPLKTSHETGSKGISWRRWEMAFSRGNPL